MKRIAFSALNLSVETFWSLTPGEIYMMSKGYNERIEAERELVAWHACNIMNVHLKKKVTIKKLLGKEKQMTSLDKTKELEKLNKALFDLRERTNNVTSNS